MKLNAQFSELLQKLGLRLPEILLPKTDIDLKKWSVVACDQYTSDQEYWTAVENNVGNSPSTLRLTLPEIYLENPLVQVKIESIHSSMNDYLAKGLLQNQGECIMYVERTTAASGLRQGLVLAVDLERYSYAADSKSLIRATEGTIVDRIPPRLQVRRQASLELPHIMILINDPQKKVVESLSARNTTFVPVYDLDLMAHGGHVRGFKIEKPEDVQVILSDLEELLLQTIKEQKTETPLFFAMGDGNHSLATAKALWEEIKQKHQEKFGNLDGLSEHPARFALAEIVNIHSPGLRFEPIHRAIFTTKQAEMTEFLKTFPGIASMSVISEKEAQAWLGGSAGQNSTVYFNGVEYLLITFSDTDGKIPPGLVDSIHSAFKSVDPQARVDFIHGWNDNKKLVANGAVCFFLPVIARERLFSQVQAYGPLPRKAFSMGDAEEKRYYMESRQITG